MKRQLWMLLSLCIVTLARGERLAPQQLQAAEAGGEKVTLIDLRPQDAYAKGTLPDAMRMGVREALGKDLAGKVVFFDDGLGVNRARRAVDAFAAAGKTAVELAGGFAAWKAAGFPTSERKGVSERLERYVTYQDLAGAMTEDAADVVLVDVREVAPAPVRPAMAVLSEGEGAISGSAVTNASAAPLDLAAELPAYRVTRQPLAAEPQRKALSLNSASPSPAAVQPLYVLIDSGDGQAVRKAAELRSSGCARVAVLAGGETIIRRKGEAGLVRRGPGTGLVANGSPEKNLVTINKEVTP